MTRRWLFIPSLLILNIPWCGRTRWVEETPVRIVVTLIVWRLKCRRFLGREGRPCQCNRVRLVTEAHENTISVLQILPVSVIAFTSRRRRTTILYNGSSGRVGLVLLKNMFLFVLLQIFPVLGIRGEFLCGRDNNIYKIMTCAQDWWRIPTSVPSLNKEKRKERNTEPRLCLWHGTSYVWAFVSRLHVWSPNTPLQKFV